MEAVVILKLRFGLGEERHSKLPLYKFPTESEGRRGLY